MSNSQPLTQAQKERIYWGKQKGQTFLELAAAVGCSVACVRKWWRFGRDHGFDSLSNHRQGRSKTGALSQFDAAVQNKALEHKRLHRRWGANRVKVELEADESLHGVVLPQPSTLAAFFKERCPECVAARKVHLPHTPRPAAATTVHEVWQLDSQEGIELLNGEIATVCNLRDPVGAAMLASQAFSVKTKLHWRKLAWTEVRAVLRQAFTEWHTLPGRLLTDNELGLAGGPNDPFPGQLTLWLVGLGIPHQFIRPGCPTDQPEIERNHRTLDDFTTSTTDLADLPHFQQALDREREMHNAHFPTRASDCDGQPPLVAHPELLKPRRYYQPEIELALFSLQRVYDYLATFTFERKVSVAAQVSLGYQVYSIGISLAQQLTEKVVQAKFDAQSGEWVFLKKPVHPGEPAIELARRMVKRLDVTILTGLIPQESCLPKPVQLSFPF
jgi:transposase InsO family protein